MSRLTTAFQKSKPALVTFVMAGDPNMDTSREVLLSLPDAGADVVELGMPFSDPMADGPSIQLAGERALQAGATMEKTLGLARAFRQRHPETPLVLMGYYNPIFIYGPERFAHDASAAGVDGTIIVDLPPEEDGELVPHLTEKNIDFIRLVTPTTDEKRLAVVLKEASGFVYYVSVTGITGGQSAAQDSIGPALERIRRHTDLPIAVGFGIKTPQQAAEIAKTGADGVVVGSALVDAASKAQRPSQEAHHFVEALAKGIRAA